MPVDAMAGEAAEQELSFSRWGLDSQAEVTEVMSKLRLLKSRQVTMVPVKDCGGLNRLLVNWGHKYEGVSFEDFLITGDYSWVIWTIDHCKQPSERQQSFLRYLRLCMTHITVGEQAFSGGSRGARASSPPPAAGTAVPRDEVNTLWTLVKEQRDLLTAQEQQIARLENCAAFMYRTLYDHAPGEPVTPRQQLHGGVTTQLSSTAYKVDRIARTVWPPFGIEPTPVQQAPMNSSSADMPSPSMMHHWEFPEQQ